MFINVSKVLLLCVMLVSCQGAYATACTVKDQNGRLWITPTNTAKTIGTIATLKPCPATIKYAAPTAPVVDDGCSAKFICSTSWGVIFNLDKIQNDGCSRVHINKADLSDSAVYSGITVSNGIAACKP